MASGKAKKRITPQAVHTRPQAEAEDGEPGGDGSIRVITGPITAEEAAARSSLGPNRRIRVDLTKTSVVNWKEVRQEGAGRDLRLPLRRPAAYHAPTGRSWWSPTLRAPAIQPRPPRRPPPSPQRARRRSAICR